MNNHPGRKNMRTYLALAMTVAAFGIASTAHAQTYPSRPVRWIVPFAPGGSQDVLVRVVAPELSTLLATPVLVDNKAGAGGSLAMLELTKAAPDGYTVSIGGSGTHAINPHLYPDIPFNPTRDHAGPGGSITDDPHSGAPDRSIQQDSPGHTPARATVRPSGQTG